MNNKIFIKLIRIIHYTLLTYLILGPIFFKNHNRKIISILLFILFRWTTNNHKCMLTSLENKMSGKEGGFIYRIVNPIYKLNENKFQKNLYFLTFSWLFVISLLEFYRNEKLELKDI